MPTIKIFIAYSVKDEGFLHEFRNHLKYLRLLSEVELWEKHYGNAGEPIAESISRRLAAADVILMLLSAEFLNSADYAEAIRYIGARKVQVIPILLRPCLYQETPLAHLQALPRGGRAVSLWQNRDEAWVSVTQDLGNYIQDLTGVPSRIREMEPESQDPGAIKALGWIGGLLNLVGSMGRPRKPPPGPPIPIGAIFRISGPPDITFVEPDQMPRLRGLLDTMGPGLVVEGPSGVGKTTAVRKAMGRAAEHWLRGGVPEDVEKIDRVFRGAIKGHVVVDDFHRLNDERKRRIAIRIKAVADQEHRDAKITVIGINPVGYSLTEGLPDLAGRFQVISLDRQSDKKIDDLIYQGEQAANIRFVRRADFISEADGSMFTAQRLCYEAALLAGISHSKSKLTEVHIGPLDVLETVRSDLHYKYQTPLRAFASHCETPPPRGACLALLWLLSQSRNGHISFQEGRLRYPGLSRHFDWLQKSNLDLCFSQTPQLSGLIYYNGAAGILSVEDPQLKFYLNKMAWTEFASETGHTGVSLHPVDGLLLPANNAVQGGISVSEPQMRQDPAEPVPAVSLLHLSDLHFADTDQATIWYAQLAEDLREQRLAKLDAVVISGDIGNFSRPEEYVPARMFLESLMGGFGLSPERLVLVPGNHDVSWDLSRQAYTLHQRHSFRTPLTDGHYIAHGSEVIEVRDENAYKRRFQNFSNFYREVKGEEYPTDYMDQATLHYLPEHGLLILGLNSAWEIDHHFRSRASIHPGALAKALNRLHERPSTHLVGLAVWHHPLTSSEPDHVSDISFMQQLAKAGFRIALHGHIHRADNQTYRYDITPDGRRIEVLGAGTFGAPRSQWVPGYPLQYNLLKIVMGTVTVETRCREEVNGAWRPDARWLAGPGRNPEPRYHVKL